MWLLGCAAQTAAVLLAGGSWKPYLLVLCAVAAMWCIGYPTYRIHRVLRQRGGEEA